MKLEKQKYYFIYQTTNKLNGKYYIGKHETYNLNDGYIGSGLLLHKAINKYGIENFERTILFFVNDIDSLNFAEKETVTEEIVNDPMSYNLKVGGDGGWDFINDPSNNIVKGFQWINEHKLNNKSNQCYRTKELLKIDSNFKIAFSKNISNGLKNHWKTYPHPWIGKHHKEETKVKIGKANSIHQIGSKNSNYGHHWWMNPETGESCSIKEGDPIPEGWIKGRRCKKS